MVHTCQNQNGSYWSIVVNRSVCWCSLECGTWHVCPSEDALCHLPFASTISNSRGVGTMVKTFNVGTATQMALGTALRSLLGVVHWAGPVTVQFQDVYLLSGGTWVFGVPLCHPTDGSWVYRNPKVVSTQQGIDWKMIQYNFPALLMIRGFLRWTHGRFASGMFATSIETSKDMKSFINNVGSFNLPIFVTLYHQSMKRYIYGQATCLISWLRQDRTYPSSCHSPFAGLPCVIWYQVEQLNAGRNSTSSSSWPINFRLRGSGCP